jgi:hypothetical protein
MGYGFKLIKEKQQSPIWFCFCTNLKLGFLFYLPPKSKTYLNLYTNKLDGGAAQLCEMSICRHGSNSRACVCIAISRTPASNSTCTCGGTSIWVQRCTTVKMREKLSESSLLLVSSEYKSSLALHACKQFFSSIVTIPMKSHEALAWFLFLVTTKPTWKFSLPNTW